MTHGTLPGLLAWPSLTHSARMIQPATRAGKCNFSTLRLFMHPSRVLLLAALAALLTGCGDSDSPEQQVRQVIDEMETAAEARDVGDLLRHLSDEYRDANGMSAQEAVRYVRGYFIANQSIHLLTRIEQIEFPLPDEARARLLVGMVGRDADAAGNWDLAADLYEFKVTLRQEGGEWRVSFAQWKRR
jgi:hypothetical protein